jgi:4-hydroxy-3-methylbut-2-enyl diphosphate reductase
MIHNPQVNADLVNRGVEFLQDTAGKQLIPFDALNSDDIVIIPAFGTTLAIEKTLRDLGIPMEKYNTTCPFVEKVWNRSDQIAAKGYSIVIHGKPKHEETRATFSHAASFAPSIVITDMQEAILLASYIKGDKDQESFYTDFAGRYSAGFDALKDLQRIGVVNQTTQLASDTQSIADYLKNTMRVHFGLSETEISSRFADTRDTLCYATNDNQTAVMGMLQQEADLAIVIGGYNSSNTTHLVELCEEKLPTYFINTESSLVSAKDIIHYNFHTKEELLTTDYLPATTPARVLITSGASCPDAVVERAIQKLVSFYGAEERYEKVQSAFINEQ